MKAHLAGNTDATNNLAYFYLNNRHEEAKPLLGKALLKYAHIHGNKRASEHLLQFEMITNRNELFVDLKPTDDVAMGCLAPEE